MRRKIGAQRLWKDDELAAAPVVGVVLLVVITVILAGLVAVLGGALAFPGGSRLSASTTQRYLDFTTTILFLDVQGDGLLDRMSYRLVGARSSDEVFGGESVGALPPAFGPLSDLEGDPATAPGPVVFVDADGDQRLSAADFFLVHVLTSLEPLISPMAAQLQRAEAGAPSQFTAHVAHEVSEEIEDALEELLEEEDDSLQERFSEAAEELREAVEELFEHPQQLFNPRYAARLGEDLNVTADLLERLAGWELLYAGNLLLLDPSGNLFASFRLTRVTAPA